MKLLESRIPFKFLLRQPSPCAKGEKWKMSEMEFLAIGVLPGVTT
jgi:hypothetical protein